MEQVEKIALRMPLAYPDDPLALNFALDEVWRSEPQAKALIVGLVVALADQYDEIAAVTGKDWRNRSTAKLAKLLWSDADKGEKGVWGGRPDAG
jgi:hypothetical protein